MKEQVQTMALARAALIREASMAEGPVVGGLYSAACYAPLPHMLREYIEIRDRLTMFRAHPGVPAMTRREAAQLQCEFEAIPLEEKWRTRFENLVTTEGKNAILTHFLKGSAYIASQVLGLLEDTGYSAVAVGNTAANITAAGGGSPTNGWNEAQSSTCAARQTPSFGTAASGSLAASATTHAILATDTIKGAFLLCRSTGGTAPTTTVGNTNGALYSAGLFSSPGDRAVANGDTLSVTYTASAT